MPAVWKLELFGGLRAVREAQVVQHFRTQKTASLLAYLAYFRRAHPREVLVHRFWPDDEWDSGRHKLSVALSSLRQQLEPVGVPAGEVIVADRATVALGGAVESDVEMFDEALRGAAGADGAAGKAAHLARAVELYRGELLSGLYEPWIFPEQERQAHRFLEALRQLTALELLAGRPAAALEVALRAVAADPLCEALHQEVMRLCLELGRPAAALRQYREMERLLGEELDGSPSPASRALLEAAGAAAGRGTGDAEPAAAAASVNRRRRPESERPAGAGATESGGMPHAPALGNLPGGALPLGSPLYVVREADRLLVEGIAGCASILLLRGSRQVGKTSLLARVLDRARKSGDRVVSIDLQSLSALDLASIDSLLLALACEIADQLDLPVDPAVTWQPARSAHANFRRFLRREVLESASSRFVWGLDEADRLFAFPFHSEFFGLCRSWHNQRALDPLGPWERLTQVIAYATEAHLFIADPNQSPFNVGIAAELGGLTPGQTAELNLRYGAPLSEPELARFHEFVGGHPFLIQHGLHCAAQYRRTTADDQAVWLRMQQEALADDGPLAGHLRRILLLLRRSPELSLAMREVLHGRPCPDLDAYYRLYRSGVLTGPSPETARPRCPLYAGYLARHLL